MVTLVPITNKQCKFSIRYRIWDWYDGSLRNIETPKTPSSSMQFSWREIGEGSNLILGLKLVRPVRLRRNGAIGSKHTILPWCFSLFDPIPVTFPTKWKKTKNVFSTLYRWKQEEKTILIRNKAKPRQTFAGKWTVQTLETKKLVQTK